MAQKGTFAAYQQLRPVDLNVDETLRDIQDREAAYAQQREARRKERELAKKSLTDKFATTYGNLTDVVTKNKSVNEAYARSLVKAKKKLRGMHERAKVNPALMDDYDFIVQMKNLDKFSKDLSTASSELTKYYQDINTGLEDGTVSDYMSDAINDSESIFLKKQFDVSVGDDGSPVGVFAVTDDEGNLVYDDDGDVVLKDMSLSSIFDGTGLPPIIKRYNLTENAIKIGEKLGKRVKGTPGEGFTYNKRQSFEDIEDDARMAVRGIIGFDQPTPEAKSIWADVMGMSAKEKYTEADMKAIEDTYINAIKPYYDTEDDTATNYSAQQAALSRAQKAEEGSGVLGTFDIVTKDGKINTKELEGVAGDLRGEAIRFSLPVNPKTKMASATVMNENGSLVEVDRLYILENGNLAYEGFELVGKASGKPLNSQQKNEYLVDLDGGGAGRLSYEVSKKKMGGGADANSTVLTNLAKHYGYRNQDELKAVLQSQIDSYEGFNPFKSVMEQKSKTKDVSQMTAAEKIEYYTNLKK